MTGTINPVTNIIKHCTFQMEESAQCRNPAVEGHVLCEVHMRLQSPDGHKAVEIADEHDLVIPPPKPRQMRFKVSLGSVQAKDDKDVILAVLEAWFNARLQKKLPPNGIANLVVGSRETLIITGQKTGEMMKVGSKDRKTKAIVSIPIGLDGTVHQVQLEPLADDDDWEPKVFKALCPMCKSEGKSCDLDGRNRRGYKIRYCRPYRQLAAKRNRQIEAENATLSPHERKPQIEEWEITEDDLREDALCGHHAFAVNKILTDQANAEGAQLGEKEMVYAFVPFYDKDSPLSSEEREKWEAAGKPDKMRGHIVILDEEDEPHVLERDGELSRLQKDRERRGGSAKAQETASAFMSKGGLTVSMREMLRDALEDKKAYEASKRNRTNRGRNGHANRDSRK